MRKRIKYYTDGSIESEKSFLNKKEHGSEKKYEWETGKLKTEKNYEDGKLGGKYTETYAETNKITVQGQYKEGKKRVLGNTAIKTENNQRRKI